MKNLLCLLIVGLAISTNLNSQVELGLATGMNISNVQVKGVAEGFNPKRNFIKTFRPALVVNIPLDDHLSIATGIATEDRGFDVFIGQEINFLGLSFPIGATAKTRVSYIEVPLNFKIDFSTNNNLRPWISAGANLGYAYQGDITTQVNLILNINVNRTDINLDADNIGRWDIAPNIVAGLDIPYNRGFFTFSVGYEHSAQNFIKDAIIGIETRHYGFTPAFGYTYAFGKVSKA